MELPVLDKQLPILDREGLETPSTSRGRPTKCFEDSSKNTKRRKVQYLLTKGSPDELNYVTSVSLRKSGRRNLAFLLRDPAISSKINLKKKTKIIPGDVMSLLLNREQDASESIETSDSDGEAS
ncbi:hypothetical protein ILUMI_03893 [Ignelater luminosus]|uniref:Uncharacterized protein n=1 Tax=Ignelater luminosus TaxID=2038154 RepID=A0A8K0GLQ6_IGNLU|nr:hypothetical protein ILUMI_03893 [Ignelater luminosus]